MNIIASLCYFMNKKLGQSESSFEVEKKKRKKLKM